MLKKKAAIIFLSAIVLFACSNPNAKTTVAPPAQIENSNNVLTATLAEPNGETDQTSSDFVATKSNNGVTTTITWVYIDEYRLAFEVQVAGVDVPAGYQLVCPIRATSIVDKQGYPYESYENGYGESENLSVICSRQNASDIFVATYSFYHNRTGFTQADISLIVSLGKFELFTESGQQMLLPDFGTYVFDLSFPTEDTLTIVPDMTTELSGITATLNRVEVNPAFTVAKLCIQYEDHHGWYPDVSLIVNGRDIPANPELTLWTNYDPNSEWYDSFTSFRCYRFVFPVELIANSTLQTMNLGVSLYSLKTNVTDAITQDECAKFRNEIQIVYPDLDFMCHIDYRGDGYGFSLEITKTPFGMSMETANKIIEDGFKKNVSGPWLFSVELSE